ncbi:MAG: hypothetical protein ABF290_04855 [Thiogranum sp.]|jgi:hypothetical protein
MKIDGALTHAITGIQRGLDNAQHNAARIANADQLGANNPSSLVEPLLGLQQDSLQVQASTQVLKAVDDMIGSLFDDKA